MFLGFAFGSFATAKDEVTLLSQQIGWTAANLENKNVVTQFQNTFKELKADKAKLARLQNSKGDLEGRKILRQGEQLQAVIQLQEKLKKCELEQGGALGIRESISKALGTEAQGYCDCDDLTSVAPKVLRFKSDLDQSFKKEAQQEIIANAQAQMQATKEYWGKLSRSYGKKEAAIDLAIELAAKERNIANETPKAGAELLLYTRALKDRTNKNYVAVSDVQNAFNEVQTELKSNAEYLQTMTNTDPDTALKKLLSTNPAAAAQYLMAHPEAHDIICNALKSIDHSLARDEKIDNAFFWGGMVIAGVLIATGIGAVAGVAAAGTLATIAAGTALVGTATGVGEAAYRSNRTHDAYIEAQNIRSSSYAQGLSPEALERIQNANDKAYDELGNAGFATLTILPYGYAFKYMRSVAMASRLGSTARLAKEGAKVEAESVSALAATLKEISSDDQLLKILHKSSAKVSETEMAEFLGYLSSLPIEEKKQIYALMKAQPDRVPSAIQKTSKKVVCK